MSLRTTALQSRLSNVSLQMQKEMKNIFRENEGSSLSPLVQATLLSTMSIVGGLEVDDNLYNEDEPKLTIEMAEKVAEQDIVKVDDVTTLDRKCAVPKWEEIDRYEFRTFLNDMFSNFGEFDSFGDVSRRDTIVRKSEYNFFDKAFPDAKAVKVTNQLITAVRRDNWDLETCDPKKLKTFNYWYKYALSYAHFFATAARYYILCIWTHPRDTERPEKYYRDLKKRAAFIMNGTEWKKLPYETLAPLHCCRMIGLVSEQLGVAWRTLEKRRDVAQRKLRREGITAEDKDAADMDCELLSVQMDMIRFLQHYMDKDKRIAKYQSFYEDRIFLR